MAHHSLLPARVPVLRRLSFFCRRSILTTSLATMTVWAYVGMNAALLWRTPDIALLSPNALAGFTGFAGLVTTMAYGGSRAAMRYAVLSADGLFVRLYPYGAVWGMGVGAPVTVPIKLMTVGESVKRAFTGVDPTSLYVGINGSVVQLTFDKPDAISQWVGGAGSGILWSAKGLAGALPTLGGAAALPPTASAKGTASATSAAAGSSSSSSTSTGDAATGGGPVVSPAMLYALPSAQRSAIRRYALLVHVLRGHPVAMDRVHADDWEVEAMIEQLNPERGRKPVEQRVAELRYWRPATDEVTGRPYWYHLVTWARQWTPPMVEGRGPLEWHVDLCLVGAQGGGEGGAETAVPAAAAVAVHVPASAAV